MNLKLFLLHYMQPAARCIIAALVAGSIRSSAQTAPSFLSSTSYVIGGKSSRSILIVVQRFNLAVVSLRYNVSCEESETHFALNKEAFSPPEKEKKANKAENSIVTSA